MRVDERAATELTPATVQAYLAKTGWVLRDLTKRGGAVWAKPGRRVAEILVPLDRSLGDYGTRMRDVLSTLRAEERREVTIIIQDIKRANSDVVRVRVIGDQTDLGIPIQAGVAVFETTFELVTLAAQAAVVESVDPRWHAEAFRTLLGSVVLGEAELGSFVATILIPAAEPHSGPTEAANPATLHLVRILTSLKEHLSASINYAQEREFVEACAALARLASDTSLVRIEVMADFGGLRRAEERPDVVLERAELVQARHVAVEEAKGGGIAASPARRLEREEIWHIGASVVGLVTVLRRPWVSIRGSFDGRVRTIKAILGDEDYSLAIEAHASYAEVMAVGDIAQRGSSYTMRSVTAFVVSNPLA